MGVFEPLYSQDFISECPHNQFIDGKSSPQDLIGGFYKPQRTDVAGAPEYASFRALLVFVQFANETLPSDEWPIGGAPIYMNELLALKGSPYLFASSQIGDSPQQHDSPRQQRFPLSRGTTSRQNLVSTESPDSSNRRALLVTTLRSCNG